MKIMDLKKVKHDIENSLSDSTRSAVDVHILGESGLQIRVDGAACLTSIGVWPNGFCDIEYLYVESEKGSYEHHEFTSEADAARVLVPAVALAISRGSG
jgi:hypothetical protein